MHRCAWERADHARRADELASAEAAGSEARRRVEAEDELRLIDRVRLASAALDDARAERLAAVLAAREGGLIMKVIAMAAGRTTPWVAGLVSGRHR